VRVDPRGRRGRDDVLVGLLEQNVQIDDDVIVLGEHVWAIHGYIAYDGEVIAAIFASEQEARTQLSRLDGLQHGLP
jgi:hypothetical protein